MSSITNRDRMQAVLAGEIIDYVPSWTMSFFNVATIQRLIPPDLLVNDLGVYPEHDTYGFAPHTPADLNKLIRFNKYIDRVAVGVGQGANHAFGHGGPGEFNTRVIDKCEAHMIVQYETGAERRINFAPHFTHAIQMPIRSVEEVEAMELPDPEKPSRWEGFRDDVAYLKAQGEYTFGNINGFFAGCHTFFMDYQDFLASLVADPLLVGKLTTKLGEWNLKAARMMLDAGVDCIAFTDDLGSDQNLLINPELYNRFFFPWHKQVCDLAHSYGAKVHMHSHGNITKILGRLVEAGVDMLNPLDQSEGMHLEEIKQRFGRRLTLVGGMDKLIFDQEPVQIECRLRRSVEVGKKGGRFILMDTGGIPETISLEKFNAFLDISRRVRGQVASVA